MQLLFEIHAIGSKNSYIDNVTQINLFAATTDNSIAVNQIYNVAVVDRATLNQLYDNLRVNPVAQFTYSANTRPVYRDFRAGDVRHSLVDIAEAKSLLGYSPRYRVGEGLREAMAWYIDRNLGSDVQRRVNDES